MDKGKQDINSFHLAGVVPIAGQPLDFNMQWHDSLMPLGPNYYALQHSVMECAYAGCETIWIVCHYDTQPLVRNIIGEYVQDPVWYSRAKDRYPSESRKLIPIYYVPIHPKDRDKRDCLGWSVLYGANTAYWTTRRLSKWTVPDKYYVSFPYGIYDNKGLRDHRKDISSKVPYILTYQGQYVRDGLPLAFTFDADDFKRIRSELRKIATGVRVPGTGIDGESLPIEERWSARYFPLDKVFESVIIKEDTKTTEVDWFHRIDSWDSYCTFLSSSERYSVTRPYNKILKYNEFNFIGEDIEQE